jgi:hypothetical protein
MRKVLAVLAATVISMWTVSAAPLPCTSGTLAVYIGLTEGCTIGDKLFSNFSYVGTGNGGAVPITAGGIGIVPITTALNPGFLFSAGWSVSSGQEQDSHIGYAVTVGNGGFAITDVSATMSGFGTSGDGLLTLAENIDSCPGHFNCNVGDLFLHYNQTASVTGQTVNITGTMGPIYVVKNLTVSGGSTGFASLSGVTQQFSEGGVVPEPLTLLLMGSGLLGLGALRLRKKS